MPFYKKLFHKIKKQVVPSEWKPETRKQAAELAEAAMMVMPALKVAKVGKVAPKVAKEVSRMPSIFGKTGQRIIREVLKDIKKPLTGEELERAVLNYRYKGGGRTMKDIAKILKIPLQQVKSIIKKY